MEADIYVARSADGGFTWAVPVRVNDDTTSKYQFWPAIAVSNSARHVAWYHFRNSPNVTDTDVGHQPNCPMLGGGTVGFHGDYIELDAYDDGVNHVVHVA